MKRYRIAVQDGLEDLKAFLAGAGFEIVPSGSEMQAEVTIIAGSEHPEEPAPARTAYQDGARRKRILIDASHLTHEQVLELITLGWKKNLH